MENKNYLGSASIINDHKMLAVTEVMPVGPVAKVGNDLIGNSADIAGHLFDTVVWVNKRRFIGAKAFLIETGNVNGNNVH